MPSEHLSPAGNASHLHASSIETSEGSLARARSGYTNITPVTPHGEYPYDHTSPPGNSNSKSSSGAGAGAGEGAGEYDDRPTRRTLMSSNSRGGVGGGGVSYRDEDERPNFDFGSSAVDEKQHLMAQSGSSSHGHGHGGGHGGYQAASLKGKRVGNGVVEFGKACVRRAGRGVKRGNLPFLLLFSA